jgi:hypothetical protein
MLQKFKITSCAFILILFGFSLMTVSPVFAEDNPSFVSCQKIKSKFMKKKKNCFRDLALELESSAADAIQAKNAKIADLRRKLSNGKRTHDVDVVELQDQLDTAWGESLAKDDTIAVLRSMISIVPSEDDLIEVTPALSLDFRMQTDLERNGCAGYNEEGKQLYECERPCVMVPVENESGDRCPEGMVIKWYDWPDRSAGSTCARPDECIGKGCD